MPVILANLSSNNFKAALLPGIIETTYRNKKIKQKTMILNWPAMRH